MKRLHALRIMVIVILLLLTFQFELGMAVNLASPAAIPPFGLSLSRVSGVLHRAGGAAVLHAILGGWLVIMSVIGLILSLRSGSRSAQVSGSLAFLATLLAAINGLLFVRSGFQGDGYSHGMATGFILSFGFYFLELYFIKPVPKAKGKLGQPISECRQSPSRQDGRTGDADVGPEEAAIPRPKEAKPQRKATPRSEARHHRPAD